MVMGAWSAWGMVVDACRTTFSSFKVALVVKKDANCC